MRALIALLIVLAGLPLAIGPAGAGRVNEEDRQTFKAFRNANKMSKKEFDRLYGATARIECRFKGQPVWASGAIVHQNHLFVTADHVFVEINGELSGPETDCRVITLFDGRRYRIKPGSVRHGFLRAGANGRGLKNDWAVGVLTEPTRVVRPYPLPPEGAVLSEGDKVILMTQGHRGWGNKKPSIGHCRVMANVLGLYVTTDCDADKGGSGGPLLEWGKVWEWGDGPFIAGILISIVERSDGKDRKIHGNLSATIANPISSAFREAILRAGFPTPRRRPWILKDLAIWDAKLAADPADATARLNHGLVLVAMGDSEGGEMELLEGMTKGGKAEPRLVTAALAVVSKEFAADNKAYPALRIRAALYRARGDTERADLEMARYRRAARAGVPPLDDEGWDRFRELMRQIPLSGYVAMAASETKSNVSWAYASEGETAWEAAYTALNYCQASYRHRCRVYALGDRVVWNERGETLERRLREYQAAFRARTVRRIERLSRGPMRDKPETLVERGRLALRLRRGHAAAEDLAAAIRSGVSDPEVRLDLALALMDDLQIDRAVEVLSPIAAKGADTVSYQAAMFRAFGNLVLGRLDATSRDAEWLIRSGEGIKPEGYLIRAGIAFARDKRAEAFASIRKTMILGSQSPTMRGAICWLLAFYAQPGAAGEHCAFVLRDRTMNAGVLESSAYVRWQLGDKDGAVKLLEDLRMVDPDSPAAEERLAQFRVELAATFLSMKGFYRGPPVNAMTEALRVAIQAFQAANGLEPTGEADDRLLGRLTPVGFGDTRMENVPGRLTAEAIRKGCRGVLRGEEVRIPVDGSIYRCNSDGVSVRKLL